MIDNNTPNISKVILTRWLPDGNITLMQAINDLIGETPEDSLVRDVKLYQDGEAWVVMILWQWMVD